MPGQQETYGYHHRRDDILTGICRGQLNEGMNHVVINIASTAFVCLSGLESAAYITHKMLHAGRRYESVIIITVMPCTATSSPTMATSLPQKMGSTSQIEWHAKPQMVSSQSTVILIFLAIANQFRNPLQRYACSANCAILKLCDFFLFSIRLPSSFDGIRRGPAGIRRRLAHKSLCDDSFLHETNKL